MDVCLLVLILSVKVDVLQIIRDQYRAARIFDGASVYDLGGGWVFSIGRVGVNDLRLQVHCQAAQI